MARRSDPSFSSLLLCRPCPHPSLHSTNLVLPIRPVAGETIGNVFLQRQRQSSVDLHRRRRMQQQRCCTEEEWNQPSSQHTAASFIRDTSLTELPISLENCGFLSKIGRVRLTVRACPVMNDDRSDTKNQTASAISLPFPYRPTGYCSLKYACDQSHGNLPKKPENSQATADC